jgi:hypothetical protein
MYVVQGSWYDVIPRFCGHKGESMKVSELIEILQDHRQDDIVVIAKGHARPFVSGVRGVVKSTTGSPVFLVEDYDTQPLSIDVWRLLDE